MQQQEYVLLFIAVAVHLTICLFKRTWRSRPKRRIRSLARRVKAITPEEFFKLKSSKSKKKGKSSYSADHNFSGVYILYNKSKHKYYVGQAQRVFNRVNSHFTGKGNGDVYADYKYGDKFTIRMLNLKRSGFATLNDLERHAIDAYDAYSKGYNKTRGNR